MGNSDPRTKNNGLGIFQVLVLMRAETKQKKSVSN